MLNRDLLEDTIKKQNVSIDDEAFYRLDKYAEMLVKTNESFNLTAITEPDDMTIKHFADCLSLFGFVDFPQNAEVIDVGTGAGFPGLVLLLTRPDLKLTFLDSTKKKLGFIESAVKEFGLDARFLHRRAEEAGQDAQFRERFDFVTARAVANLTNLSEYCLPFVKKDGLFISMKSESADKEINDAKKAVKLLGGKIEKDIVFNLSENMPRRIVLLRKISQTPTKYPRPSAKIAKNPLI